MLDLKNQILQVLGSKEDPAKLRRILNDLGLSQSDRQYVKSMLQSMVREGQVVKIGSFFWLPDGPKRSKALKQAKTRGGKQIVGRLDVASTGRGYVNTAQGEDWIVPSFALRGAVSGDLVRVERVGTGAGGRVTAELVEIVEFGTARVFGQFERQGSRVTFYPFGSGGIDSRAFQGFPSDLPDGTVGSWSRRSDGSWAFESTIGHVTDPAIDEVIALGENNIVVEFSPEVLAAASQFPEDFAFLPEGRKDFRGELVFTVDGEDARDFDDALHFRRLPSGNIEVGIHIADVSEFAGEGSVLDDWSRRQGNSVYLPHKAIPMLPQVLSNGLCSLNPGVPRYTLSVLAVLTPEGLLQNYSLHKGIIESRFRLTYNQVVTISIEKDAEVRARFAEVAPALDLGLDLSAKMKSLRLAQGGLDLDLPEIHIDLNEAGEVAGVNATHQTDANRMIEAFMCLANECVARHMGEQGIGIPFRIHDPPDVERLTQLAEFLRSYGYRVPADLFDEPGKSLNSLLQYLHGGAAADVLQTQVLKSLKLAIYSPENHGHFGLASTDYAHFTSPIRRYADLFIHQRLSRLLTNPNLGPEHFDDSQLDEICAAISKKERDAMQAERTFVNLKLLRRLQSEVGNTCQGVIVEVKKFGLFVELLPFHISGLVHVDTLGDEDFKFMEAMLALVGRRSRRIFKVGMSVEVKIVRVDFISRKIDLIPVGSPEVEIAAEDPIEPAPRSSSRKRDPAPVSRSGSGRREKRPSSKKSNNPAARGKRKK